MAPLQPGLLARLVDTPARRLTCLLLALGAVLYIPFAGNYGMWDPWETHYGEVARQMLERNDFVSQWWPGSPQDRIEFWSKPVLTFWLMAIGMKLFGIEWHPNAPADEIAASWRVEWGARMPLLLLALAGVWAVFELVRRLAGRRAAGLTALVLLTSSQWALIARQAMTDMPFVVPMTVALALAGLALIGSAEEMEAELPRRDLHVLGRKLSYPAAGAFYGFAALVALTVVPQLAMISSQLQLSLHLGATTIRTVGLVPMLPYWAVLLVGVVWCARATTRRQLYLFCAYVLCGLASLGKGPAGLAIPGIILAVWLVVSGRIRDLWLRLEIPRGVLLFIATAFPWYHAMLIRHGMGFWNEFIGDNYVRRAGGRHGDRGTFEYYVQYIGYGMFPWSGFVALGSLDVFRRLAGTSPRARLASFAVVWAFVDWALVTLVNTKFHHYILPALPALAILAALCIDELLERPDRTLLVGMAVIGLPVTFLSGRDLAAFPPRILWLFNYDYVNMPGTGRPWPLVSLYGDRYEYGSQLFVLALAITAATALFVWFARRPAAERQRVQPIDETPSPDEGMYRKPGRPLEIPEVAVAAGVEREVPASTRTPDDATPPPPPGHVIGALIGALALVGIGVAVGQTLSADPAPTISPWLWLAPTACMLPVAFFFVRATLGGVGGAARASLLCLSLAAVVWTGFVIDKVLVELSPHWAQKHVIAAYYRLRRSADEPLVAWQLYWRGENFYTKNEIYKNPNPAERTVFLGDRNVEKMKKWFETHPGRRVFFLVERIRFESLRGVLPPKSQPTLKIVDQSNNKLYLGVAEL